MKNENKSISALCTEEIIKLSDMEKLSMFSVEELEGRLETAWNDVCPSNNDCVPKQS